MKVLGALLAQVSDGDIAMGRGVVAAVHHELGPGCLVRVELDTSGLRIFNGDVGVALPLAELIVLAQAAEPRLKPPGHA